MDIDNINGYTLKNLGGINILLGKNGCGKSILLRNIESGLSRLEEWGNTKYITPERGGNLIYEGGIEQGYITDVNWANPRKKNQFNQFRQQSVAQFRRLKELVLEEIEKEKEKRENLDYTFDEYIEKLNTLLDNIKIKRSKTHFTIHVRNGEEEEIKADVISSGESELISLGIECLVFEKESEEDKNNILLLDEPDVHLHPDLQFRLMSFLKSMVETQKFIVLIATHSTAILGALHDFDKTRISFMDFGQKEIEFEDISETHRKILPVFGAHPLSNLFNEAPILLLEGEDDERIWQQAVRGSEGKLKMYPCSVSDGLPQMSDFEKEVSKIISSVYDEAKAFSLRDRDDTEGEIEDTQQITRFKLACRNAENLLLSKEVLSDISSGWEELKKVLDEWIANEGNEDHPHYQLLVNFRDGGYDRKRFDIKEARNTILGIVGYSKTWELAVGRAIAKVAREGAFPSGENSICDYLGSKLVDSLLKS